MTEQRYEGTWIERLPFDVTRTHLLRFVLALALAVFLWGWIAQMTDPIQTRNYREMDIAVPELADPMIIVTTLPSVVVRVEGPESEFDDLNRTDLRVFLDTESVNGPGEYRLPLYVEAPDTSARVSVDPGQVQVQIDELVSEVMPIEARSTQPEDDPRTVSDIIPEISQVTVSGPSSAVERVDRVVLPVSLDNRNETFTDSFTPYAIDVNEQRVSEVEVLPSQIPTLVEIESRGKVISVIPVVNGVPAEGFSVQQRAVFPDTVVVDGPTDALDSLLFINTLPVDITGATENVSEMVGLADLPTGVAIVDPPEGLVEIRVALDDISSSAQSLSSLPVTTVNVRDGFTATVEPRTITIMVDGPGSVLAEMESRDVRVVVDVSGLEVGTHEVRPQVYLPQGVTWTATTPETVEVTIAPEEDPDSTPSSFTSQRPGGG
jgi:YbbR domain-containing protein